MFHFLSEFHYVIRHFLVQNGINATIFIFTLIGESGIPLQWETQKILVIKKRQTHWRWMKLDTHWMLTRLLVSLVLRVWDQVMLKYFSFPLRLFIQDKFGNKIPVHASLDNGSMSNFLALRIVERLRKKIRFQYCV